MVLEIILIFIFIGQNTYVIFLNQGYATIKTEPIGQPLNNQTIARFSQSSHKQQPIQSASSPIRQHPPSVPNNNSSMNNTPRMQNGISLASPVMIKTINPRAPASMRMGGSYSSPMLCLIHI